MSLSVIADAQDHLGNNAYLSGKFYSHEQNMQAFLSIAAQEG